MEILDYSKLLQDGLELRTDWGNANLRCHKLGELVTPTGKIVACDPFMAPETSAFTLQFSPGRYPVVASVAHFGNRDQRVAYAALRIRDGQPHHWEMALLPDQDVDSLEPDYIFGYGVDSGTGCFMDQRASEVLTERMNADEDYFQVLIAEMDKTYVHTWSWANLEMDTSTNANLIAFSSGFGDGCYASYFGLDEKGNPMILVTDFGLFND
ncbi:MAG TPA: DUF4241 domain-containing protein, partial [Anaerolineales bacterium]|nr:DUF4241 domain-containing protein [Anaerolineales bacterium]